MRIKLDENLGVRTKNLFAAAGHDVHTVREEGLEGSSDTVLYEVCRDEERCLVTLDLDFADTVRFPPGENAGIAVIRFRENPSMQLLEKSAMRLLEMMEQHPIRRQLWIIDTMRIRIHSETD